MNRPHALRLWFATGPTFKSHWFCRSWRGQLALLWRQPSVIYYIWACTLIRWLTFSNLSHVMVEAGDVVLDPMFDRTRFWGFRVFDRKFDGGLRCSIAIPPWQLPIKYFGVKVDLAQYETHGSRCHLWTCVWGTIRYFTMWLTMGRVLPQRDCIWYAKDALRQVGINVPKSVWTPRGLMRWMESKGYACTSTTPSTHDTPAH